MANEIPELKPCPFCGGTDIRDRTYSIASPVEYFGQFSCGDCDVVGPLSECKHDNEEDARKDGAASWNARTAPKVKPLVFVEDGDRWLTRRAEGYVITTHTVAPHWGVNDPHGNDLGVYDLLSDAEEAAQKDWREFISIHIE